MTATSPSTRSRTWTATSCPTCGAHQRRVFHEVRQVPAHSVLLMPTREEALGYPSGDITLAFCEVCGLISNVTFDRGLHEYSARYEETQGFSATFNAFHRRLALRLIERYGLRDKDIIEIGCGKGEFLALLCELGGNRGIGFDPAYVSERDPSGRNGRVRFIDDFYSEKYAEYRGDFVCCKMTLEHIPETAGFVRTVRRGIGDRPETVVFFQVPDVTRILREFAFWDIYYEHCSYFTAGSLARLFRRCGFDVLDVTTDYAGQYLLLEARPSVGVPTAPGAAEDDLGALACDVARFAERSPEILAAWRSRLAEFRRRGRRTVIWGAGSKGVAFLTTLQVHDEVQYAVDINPYKRGTYMAGTGHEIVEPDFLRAWRPDVVIVMNPVYQGEVAQQLSAMGLYPELVTV